MRHGRMVLVGAAASLLLASGPVLAQKGGGDEPPLTLTLAIADGQGRQSEPAVNDLVAKVAELSNGNITIEPTFGAGDATEKGFEEGVADLVKSGQFDLGMTATRAWDLAGVTSLRAFQAPLLIDNDALALAVAKSDIAAKAMRAMGNGVTGLALWPEDLRHLMAFPPGGRVFRTPADVQGARILVIPSATSRSVVEALGGVVYQEGVTTSDQTGDRGGDADSGVLKGMEAGLWGAGLPRTDAVAIGDVVVYPKYQMLVANDQSLAKLTDTQRQVLDQAVSEMRDGAFSRQFGEAALAKTFCTSGGSVIEAGPGAEDAFRALMGPVNEQLAKDPLTAELIADITALKAQTPASPPAPACSPDLGQASPAPSDPTLAGFVGTDIPNGSYRATVTQEDMLSKGVAPNWAGDNWGTKTWTFNHGAVTFDQGEHGGTPCYGSAESVGGNYVHLVTSGGGCGFDGYLIWKPVDGGIVLRNWPGQPLSGDGKYGEIFLNRTWTLVPPPAGASPAPASDMPAVGTWRSHRTQEQLWRFLPRDTAFGRDGEYTMTFDGSRWTGFETCGGPYDLENGYLHLIYELDVAHCGTPPLDLIWVNVGPTLAYVSGAPGTGDVDKATVTGDWTLISDEVPSPAPAH